MSENKSFEAFQDTLANMVNKGILYAEKKDGEFHYGITEYGSNEMEKYKYYLEHIAPKGGYEYLIGKKCPICKFKSTRENKENGIYDEKHDKVICGKCWFEWKKRIGNNKKYEFEKRL